MTMLNIRKGSSLGEVRSDRVEVTACLSEHLRSERTDGEEQQKASTLRILHVVYTLDPSGGGSVEAARLFAASSGNGCSIEVLSLDEDVTPFLKYWKVPVHSAGTSLSSYRYVPRLVGWMRRHATRFDAVVVHGIWHYHLPAVWRALRTGPIPYFVVLHGMLNPWFKRTYWLKHVKKSLFWKAFVARAVEGAAAVLFLCEEESRLAQETFEFRPRNHALVPLGVRVEPISASAFFEKFPELREKRLIVFLGRICYMKGCDLLLDAFATVSRQCPDAHLVICGPDSERWQERLIRRAKELDVSRSVTWTGPLYADMKWSVLRAADLLALPSRCETFPITVLEALGCGVPVLITEEVNIWKAVRDTGAGFVCGTTVRSVGRAMEEWFAMSHAERWSRRQFAKECFARNYELDGAVAKHLAALRAFMPSSSGIANQA